MVFSQVVFAGSFEDGLAAYERGDYSAAGTEFRKAAEQGDLRGQALLGSMYDHGQGVTQDYKEAAKWYRKAAEQGDRLAQYSLGVMYYEG